ETLRRLHFQKLYVEGMTHPAIPIDVRVTSSEDWSGAAFIPAPPPAAQAPPPAGKPPDWRTAPPPPRPAHPDREHCIPVRGPGTRRDRDADDFAEDEERPRRRSRREDDEEPILARKRSPRRGLAVALIVLGVLLLLGLGVAFFFLWPR